ncbi:MAG: hypothetical protein HYY40_14565 [Bacteroidetes bacterium]|nr:hypothetical protein [Bacteroidota bacterium]
MKAILYLLAAGLLFATVVKSQTTINLQEGEVVTIKTLDTLNSDKNAEGEIFYLEVVNDVIVNNKVVITKGSKATAMITKSIKRGVMGKGGELEFSLDYVKSVDGQNIKLRNPSAGVQGKSKQTEAIVGAAAVHPVFLIMKGKAAIIPGGTIYSAYVEKSYQVQVQ